MANRIRAALERLGVTWRTIYGREGEHETPYLTQVEVGRLRLHVFHRGDADPDPHDHMWDFWTLPLQAYVEEVMYWVTVPVGPTNHQRTGRVVFETRVVPARRVSFRRAEHAHRVLGRSARSLYDAGTTIGGRPMTRPGRVVTIVWRGRRRRDWGFWSKHAVRDGVALVRWVPWREYVYPTAPPAHHRSPMSIGGETIEEAILRDARTRIVEADDRYDADEVLRAVSEVLLPEQGVSEDQLPAHVLAHRVLERLEKNRGRPA